MGACTGFRLLLLNGGGGWMGGCMQTPQGSFNHCFFPFLHGANVNNFQKNSVAKKHLLPEGHF